MPACTCGKTATSEIVDPETLEPVPDGETGELVLTILCATPCRSSLPRGSDPCDYGPGMRTNSPPDRTLYRPYRRHAHHQRREHFPSQIEEALLRTKGVGANYLIVVEKDGVLDRMTIKVEITPEMFADDTRVINALRERIRDELTALITIRPLVEIKQPGSLPVAEGKAKRVEDLRNS